MVAIVGFENDILDMCMMDFKTLRSLTALSMARMINIEHFAEGIGV
jgi:hypothetical protein